MLLIVGLGNPGAKYAKNRHNVGFMALDRIAADHGFGPWRARFQGEVAEGRLRGVRVMLLKPATYMNNSGQAVGEAMRYLKLTPADVIVLHDEMDLPLGKLRMKTGGGHAGHNGLRSIHQHISEAYRRMRIGVGHPGSKERVVAHVLSDFAKAEVPVLENLLAAVSQSADLLVEGDGARFQTAVAARLSPARNGGDSGKTPEVKRGSPAPEPAPTGPADMLRALVDKFR